MKNDNGSFDSDVNTIPGRRGDPFFGDLDGVGGSEVEGEFGSDDWGVSSGDEEYLRRARTVEVAFCLPFDREDGGGVVGDGVLGTGIMAFCKGGELLGGSANKRESNDWGTALMLIPNPLGSMVCSGVGSDIPFTCDWDANKGCMVFGMNCGCGVLAYIWLKNARGSMPLCLRTSNIFAIVCASN
jgi:hypothetical protein